MTPATHPETGGRVVLKREPADAPLVPAAATTPRAAASGDVRYAAQLFTPSAEWRAPVHLELAAGRIDISAWRLAEVAEGKKEDAEAPPSWLVEQLRAMLRAAWRNAAASRAPDQLTLNADQLPRRITRWRAPPADSHVMPDARRAPTTPAGSGAED